MTKQVAHWKWYILAVATVCALLMQQGSRAQLAAPTSAPATAEAEQSGEKFYFEVTESTDAQYLGDTPGHTGRGGGLAVRKPNVAVGDPVHTGENPVGYVSHVRWDRAGSALTIEFDPAPFSRVAVGQTCWVWINGPPRGHAETDINRKVKDKALEPGPSPGTPVSPAPAVPGAGKP